MRNISTAGIQFIKNHEGLRLKAYKPVKEEPHYTIGYGHFGADVRSDLVITKEQAERMLVFDLQRFVNYVNDPAYVPFTKDLNQNQFDALVSFAFNTGQGNLRTLCAKRTIKEIPAGMRLYNKGSGRVLPGLVTRREKEAALFSSPVKVELPKPTPIPVAITAPAWQVNGHNMMVEKLGLDKNFWNDPNKPVTAGMLGALFVKWDNYLKELSSYQGQR